MADPILEKRIADVERRLREVETEQRRLKSDILVDVDDRNAAAVRLVEDMIANHIGTLRADVEEIKRDGKTQLVLLTDAAEERGRRKQREEELKLRAQQASISGEEKKTDAEVGLIAAKSASARWKGIAIAIAIVFGAIGTLIGAVLGSHH